MIMSLTVLPLLSLTSSSITIDSTDNMEFSLARSYRSERENNPQEMTALVLEIRGSPIPTNPRKRSRSHFEDLDSENSDRPSQSRARRSPSPPSSPPPVCVAHPFLLDVTTSTSTASTDLLARPLTDSTCAICLDITTLFPSQTFSRHAACSPTYHTSCLERWVSQGNPTCPYCRARLLPPLTEPNVEDHDGHSDGEDENEDDDWEQENRILTIALRSDIVEDPVGLVWGTGAFTRLLRGGQLRGYRWMFGGGGGGEEEEDEDEVEEVEDEVDHLQQEGVDEREDEREDDEEEQRRESFPSEQPLTGSAAYIQELFAANEY